MTWVIWHGMTLQKVCEFSSDKYFCTHFFKVRCYKVIKCNIWIFKKQLISEIMNFFFLCYAQDKAKLCMGQAWIFSYLWQKFFFKNKFYFFRFWRFYFMNYLYNKNISINFKKTECLLQIVFFSTIIILYMIYTSINHLLTIKHSFIRFYLHLAKIYVTIPLTLLRFALLTF